MELQPPILQAIVGELHIRKTYLSKVPIHSIYIGGTPSLLTASDLSTLLETIEHHFAVNKKVEITLEADPKDITWAQLQAWQAIGINRLSINVQSFQNAVLEYLNINHTGQHAVEGMQWAHKAGFDNVSIDLVYAIPGVDQVLWEADLKTVQQLQPAHVAAYDMPTTQATIAANSATANKHTPVPETAVVKQFETLIAHLAAAGYEHYEVGHFCQPGRYAQHNTNYWKRGPYLGLGPGAHSYDGATRQYNTKDEQHYIASLQRGVVPCTKEILTRSNHINEYIMTHLRTQWGCNMQWLQTQYGHALMQTHKHYVAQLTEHGLATVVGQQLSLTQRGMLLADRIAVDLFVDETHVQTA